MAREEVIPILPTLSASESRSDKRGSVSSDEDDEDDDDDDEGAGERRIGMVFPWTGFEKVIPRESPKITLKLLKAGDPDAEQNGPNPGGTPRMTTPIAQARSKKSRS
jgi:hypothetical protein